MIPTVSIITPTYNRAHLLPRVWQSLSKQTEQAFQWIVVDDGSTDDTRKVVHGFDDARITYVWQENQGVNGARNRGEKEIDANFVIFLDSDDELLKETTLEEMLAEICASRPEIAWVAFTVIDGEGKQGLYHLPAERVESSYIDHVCEQRFWGEFFPIYRQDALSLSPWPPYNGLEALHHWRIVRHRPALLVNRPARIYHRQAGDNLTGVHSAIRRSSQMAEAIAQLIDEHQVAWCTNCPCQIGKYRFYQAMYLSLSGAGWRAFPAIGVALIYGSGNIRRKTLSLLATTLMPLALRKQLFVWRAANFKK